ncbi:MAG: WD40 repeat domain-containing protein [Pyrinomonadaceae bacterium]
MRTAFALMLLIAASAVAAASSGNEILELKAKIGFTNGQDRIVKYNLIGEKRILLIGEKNIQIWDTENFKLINSVSHQIPQFAPRGFFSTYVLLGLPQMFELLKPYVVDPAGKFIITAEKTGDGKLKSAVIRDLNTLKQIAVLNLPNVSTEFVAFDEVKGEISTFGETDNTGAFAKWDAATFQQKNMVIVKDYKWHRLINDDKKAVVGSGETKFFWNDINIRQGDKLTLRDVETGSIEKEFTAPNLTPRNSFRYTEVTIDEKYLISTREDRIFVWEIDGDGTPRFEIPAKSDEGDYDLVKVIGSKFLAVSVDKNLRIYDIAGNGEPEFRLESPNSNDTVGFFDQTKDGRYIAVADDSKISVIKTSGDGTPVYETNRENENERFTVIKFLEDRNFLVVGRVNRTDKKRERTEFYDIETGKLIAEAPVGFTPSVSVSPDRNFLYDSGLGSTGIWNFAKETFFAVPLKIYQPEHDPNQVHQEMPYNVEHTLLSPDGKLLLKYGDVVSVYEVDTGKEVQKLFDPERVKYDKKKEIKKSGLGEVFWAETAKAFLRSMRNRER